MRLFCWLQLVLIISFFLVVTAPGVAEEPTPFAEKYTPALKSLEAFVAAEMTIKDLPGVSIALVADGKVAWTKGFGFADPDKKKAMTPQAVWPMGLVSSSPTALVLAQLANEKKVDLDLPIERYVPEFKPKNSFNTSVTLRQLLSHCSGLVRESPIETASHDRKAIVESLNVTELVYKPGSRFKYSDAGILVAEYAAELATGKSFEDLVSERILKPLKIMHSFYGLTPDTKRSLVAGTEWTSYGRQFPTTMKEIPGSFYSTPADLGRFLAALQTTAEKEASPFHSNVLKEVSSPQQIEGVSQPVCGLGFFLTRIDECKCLQNSGFAQGCTTHFALLRDDHFGVVVCINKATCGAVAERMANAALQSLLAARANKPLPKLVTSTPLKPGLARSIAGRYRGENKELEIHADNDKAWLVYAKDGPIIELRSLGLELVGDTPATYGPKVIADGAALRINDVGYARIRQGVPSPPPIDLRGLIGEYGPEANGITVFEKDGKPHLLFGAFKVIYPATILPDEAPYAGESVIFRQGADGKGLGVIVGEREFLRRSVDGEDGATFQIKPVRPIEEIRKEAIAAKPPVESSDLRKPDLVDLTTIDPGIKLDIRYATENNFMGVKLYTSARAFMQRPAAEAVGRAHKKLAAQGFGLLIHDAYRPWYVTKMFWEATPEKQHMFVADPSKGSRHNRGCAVDLTLYDLKTGKAVEMVSGYDEFSDRAYPLYPGGTSLQRYHRSVLRKAMEDEGFTVYEAEWWHFDFGEWRKYPILNTRFEDLR